MRSAVRLTLVAAAALGAMGVAASASAQTYGYARGYAPPPPPPPAPGQTFERDDRYVNGADFANSDGTYGYRNYTSRPDTTPDDPNGYAYQAQKADRFGRYAYDRDDAYGAPPPYAHGYGQPRYEGYAPSYSDPRRDARAYGDRYDDGDAPPPPPRYSQPGFGQPTYGGGYPAYGSGRSW